MYNEWKNSKEKLYDLENIELVFVILWIVEWLFIILEIIWCLFVVLGVVEYLLVDNEIIGWLMIIHKFGLLKVDHKITWGSLRLRILFIGVCDRVIYTSGTWTYLTGQENILIKNQITWMLCDVCH